ncbi:37S ribosomal protein S5 [Diplocarpon rosae]|nr:37S ribosomal protein S5 [Diplocarpon rosae]
MRPRIRCRNFHASPSLCERRRPKPAKVSIVKKPARELFKGYTPDEKALLAKKYTPEQIEAIEAGEEAISPEDLDKHGVIRSDIGTLPYLDDFSETRSVLDRPAKYKGPIDVKARLMTPEEMDKNWAEVEEQYKRERDAEWALNPPKEEKEEDADAPIGRNGLPVPPDQRVPRREIMSRLDMMKIEDRLSSFTGAKGPIPREHETYFTAPGMPKKFLEDEGEKVIGTSKSEADLEKTADPRDPDGLYNRLLKQTGMTLDDVLDLKVKILVSHRVVNQTRLGKIASFYCLAIAGNRHGRLGLGEAKGQETEAAMQNAKSSAIRNMQPIPRYEERTIFGDVDAKVSAVKVKLMSRPPGFGLRCQHLIFEMARAAGIHDLAAKVPRSRNKMNTVKAAYQAMMKQRIPDEVARGRGKKLVDVRKVYYAGRV